MTHFKPIKYNIFDENMTHVEPQARYQVPVGPVTRARARRFKEELNNLIVKLQDEEGDKLAKERIQGSQEAPMKSVIWPNWIRRTIPILLFQFVLFVFGPRHAILKKKPYVFVLGWSFVFMSIST